MIRCYIFLGRLFLFCVLLLMVVMMILFRYRRIKDVITVCWNNWKNWVFIMPEKETVIF